MERVRSRETSHSGGYVSNYTYDAGGERVTKLSGGGQGIFVNSVFAGGKTSTSDFTLYVNPYLVAQNGGRYTKHIYIGSQRIVSKLGDFDSYGADPRRVEKAGESFSGVKVNYDAKYKKSLEVVKANYDTFEVPYYGLDNNDYVNGIGFCCNPSGETSSGTSGSTTGKLMAGKNDNAELQQFYYHPDHLGSSSYITNLDGEVVQHVEYVPFGEVFLEEKNAKWNTPYLFTSKELDRETGMYYFGARYQDPKLGVFISVDPLAEKYKGWSSYAYALNNSVKFIDPTGMSASPPDDITINSKGDVTKVVKKAGANRFFDENGTQLVFNDPKNTDKHMLYGHFEVNDKIFTHIVNVFDRIKEAGEISPNVSGSYKNSSDYIKLALKSYGDWDFPTALKMEYNISDEEMNKAGYFGGSRTYFKFGNHNVIYNIADAGQFLWGNAVGNSGFSLQSVLKGVDFYENVLSGFQNGDSKEDTQAIRNGFNYQYYNQKVRGWDQE